jgi:tetratricopeptide (TPR) repeat protein
MSHFYRYVFGILVLALLLPAGGALAQQSADPAPLPPAVRLDGFRYEPQGWNNCGPATLTNALSFFGYTDNQQRAALWLKPNGEDKNVNPAEMVAFVNTQVSELPVYALTRANGTLDLLKRLLANSFPVIIEAGYDPEPQRLGWMGHYLLVIGYDDAQGQFMTHDSYEGANTPYSYEHVETFWRHFNRTYIVVYESGREPELLALLGADADAEQNALNALEMARQEAAANPRRDPFAWFNMGTSYLALAPVYGQQAYEYAAAAFDVALKMDADTPEERQLDADVAMPWRTLWYQFGPYEAYNATGQYEKTLLWAGNILNDGGGQWVEETFYYAGVAREQLGDTGKALENYRQAAYLNSNFAAARDARDRLQSAAG